METNQTSDTKVAELLKALGQAYLENGENDKAVTKYQKLYQTGYADQDTVRAYAMALASAERTDEESQDIYTKAVTSDNADEALLITLSTLFLKQKIANASALKIYYLSLSFRPQFSQELIAAIADLFRHNKGELAKSDIRNVLLDCDEHPELLSIYLSTSWQDGKFDETLLMLKDLYLRSEHHTVYLSAICKTLLEKKNRCEEAKADFSISTSDVQFCLKYRDLDAPLARAKDLEHYLDLRNLFSAYSNDPKSSPQDEYEIFLMDNSFKNIDALNKMAETPITLNPGFNLGVDLIAKLQQQFNNSPDSGYAEELIKRLTAVGILDITNMPSLSHISKLPFVTFNNWTSKELSDGEQTIVCKIETGLLVLSSSIKDLYQKISQTINRLLEFNQLVEEDEKIQLHATLHYSPTIFWELENQGLNEIRKACKVHNASLKHTSKVDVAGKAADFVLTETLLEQLAVVDYQSLGEFRLPYYPGKHKLFTTDPATQAETAAQSDEQLSDQPEATTPDQAVIEQIEQAEEPEEKSSAQTFGKYQVSDTLRKNNQYATMYGFDQQLKRPVVIKVYQPQAFADFKEPEVIRKQFYEEVRKLNRIHHPNIAVIYDAGEQESNLYLVREFIEGQSLNTYLRENPVQDLNNILGLYIRICRIIELFHRDQVWHKNLKPGNILITPQNELKIVDGGLLQLRQGENGEADIRQIAYSAPEQLQGQTLTSSCDVFQLGLMLYESLTGNQPFMAESTAAVRTKVLESEPVPPSQRRMEIPPAIDEVVMKCLTKQPQQRFNSVNAVESELYRIYNASHSSSTRRKVFDMF